MTANRVISQTVYMTATSVMFYISIYTGMCFVYIIILGQPKYLNTVILKKQWVIKFRLVDSITIAKIIMESIAVFCVVYCDPYRLIFS